LREIDVSLKSKILLEFYLTADGSLCTVDNILLANFIE